MKLLCTSRAFLLGLSSSSLMLAALGFGFPWFLKQLKGEGPPAGVVALALLVLTLVGVAGIALFDRVRKRLQREGAPDAALGLGCVLPIVLARGVTQGGPTPDGLVTWLAAAGLASLTTVVLLGLFDRQRRPARSTP